MKCQNLFSEENKKNISNLFCAELVQRVVMVNLTHVAWRKLVNIQKSVP